MFGEIQTKQDGEDENGPKIIRYSDTEVSLDDLSPDVFAAIAKAVDLDLTDSGIYFFPRESTEVAYRVVCAAAEFAGVEPPPRPTRMADAAPIKAMLEQTEDIGDLVMMEGGVPPAQSEVGSPSSSTSPAPITGPELSPDPIPSDGS